MPETTRALVALCMLLPTAAWAQSPFAGSWRGSWTDAGNRQSGPVALAIDSEGGIGGQVGNRAMRAVAPISGRIEPSGALILTYTYDDGGTFFQASGRMSMRGGRLTGVLDFLSPQGRRFGRGAFMLNLDAGEGGGG